MDGQGGWELDTHQSQCQHVLKVPTICTMEGNNVRRRVKMEGIFAVAILNPHLS